MLWPYIPVQDYSTSPANNNKPAEFKQSLIKQHIFFFSTTKIFSFSSSTECLIGLWPGVRLEGFSWAVMGEAQALRLQGYRQNSHTVTSHASSNLVRHKMRKEQHRNTADLHSRLHPLSPPLYKLFQAPRSQHIKKFTHYQETITSPFQHSESWGMRNLDSWFLCWSCLTWKIKEI